MLLLKFSPSHHICNFSPEKDARPDGLSTPSGNALGARGGVDCTNVGNLTNRLEAIASRI